jgi:hypothetical protein
MGIHADESMGRHIGPERVGAIHTLSVAPDIGKLEDDISG